MLDFRQISLIGCVYKVMVKFLTNRLRKAIDSAISDSQSTFIKGSQIIEGILIANNVVDEAHK